MEKCLKYFCCCYAKKSSNDDKLKGISKCYQASNSKRFTHKGASYIIEEQIGQGAFSEVYKVFNEKKNRNEVLKKLILKEAVDDYLQEYNMLKSLKNEFIVQFYDCLIINDDMCFLMEYAEQGSLQQLLDNPFVWKQGINAHTLLNISEGLFQGINHLQEQKILHRDLKPDNILLSSSKAKIADLGLSTLLISKYANTNVGNILYAAPEKNNVDQNGYGFKSDIYSAGMILCQLLLRLTGKQIAQITFLKNKSCLDNIPKELKDLINQLISNSPADRPACEVVIKQIKSFKSNQEILQFINDRYKNDQVQIEQIHPDYKLNKDIKSINIQDNKEEQQDVSQLNQPLLEDSNDNSSIIINNNNKSIDISNQQQISLYQPENEQWFEQNFTAGAIGVVRFKDFQKGISQFEKILKIEVRDEFRIQKKLIMIQWMMKKKNFTLQGLFESLRTQQEYKKAKEYAEEYLKIDQLNQNILSILVLSMIKLKFSELEILMEVEKIIQKVYFGGLLLFMTLNDIQKYIHVSYAQSIASNSTYFSIEVLLGCSLYFFSKNQSFSIKKIIASQQYNIAEQIEYIKWLLHRLEIKIERQLYENIESDSNHLYQFQDKRQGLCYFTLHHYKWNQYFIGQITRVLTYRNVQENLDQALKLQEEFADDLNKLSKNYLDC